MPRLHAHCCRCVLPFAQGRLAGDGMQLTGEAGPLGESDDEGEGAMAGEGGQWRQQQASPTVSAAAD